MKAVECVLEICPLYPAESARKRNIFPEFDSRDLLVDTKKNLEMVVEFLDSLLHLMR